MDFLTGVNECLKTNEYFLPSAKDIFAKLNSSKVFSELDLFNICEFAEETLKLLMINTHRGLYSFNCLLLEC